MKIPANNRWSQLNSGKLMGFLNETKGVHFDKAGTVTLSKRPSAFYTSTEDADFGALKAILYFNDTYNFITDDEFFHGDLAGSNLTKSTGSVALSKGTDAVVVYGRLYVSGDVAVDWWNGSSWNGTISVTLTTGKEHPMCEFESQNTHKLAIGNGNTVTLYNSSHSAASDVLTLPQNQEVTCIRYRSGYLYVGTKNINGDHARIYIWNGSGSAAQYAPSVGASIVSSMTEYGSSVAFVTSAGQLRTLEGSTIKTLANFPIYHAQGKEWTNTSDVYFTGKVFNRGMITDGDRIFISVDGLNEGEWVHGMYSGLWAFDPAVGLYHKAPFSDDRHTSVGGIAVDSDTITVNADHDAETGDAILVTNVGSLTGITVDTTYYAIRVSTTKFRLASTMYDAHNGNQLTIGGTATSSVFRYTPTNQIGDYYGAEQGAVSLYSPLELPRDIWNGGVIFGGKSNDGIYGVNLLTQARSVGSFDTQKIYASKIKEVWQQITPFIENLNLDNEAVRIKVKTKDKFGLPTLPRNMVWDDTNSFTTDNKIGFGAVSKGDEVTILEGSSGGRTAHVTNITDNGTTYTFDFDLELGTAGEGGAVVFDNFKLVQTITNTNPVTDCPDILLANEKSAWIMLKIEMEGYEISIPFMEFISRVDKV